MRKMVLHSTGLHEHGAETWDWNFPLESAGAEFPQKRGEWLNCYENTLFSI